jgi:hypothetical protein
MTLERSAKVGAILISLIVLPLSFNFAQAQTFSTRTAQTPISITRVEKWRQDLNYLATELPKRHKNAFHSITRKQFDHAIARLDKDIPALEDHEIIVRIRGILGMIGDTHTNLFGWEDSFHRYPFRFYRFSDGYFVTSAAKPYSNILGARLLSIGNTSINKAYDKARALLPHAESEMYVWNFAPVYLSYAEVLHTLRILPDLKQGRFTMVDRSGKQFSIEMSPILATEKMELISAAKTTPLYRQKLDEKLWYEYLPDSKTIYFMSRTSFMPPEEFDVFLSSLLKFTANNPVERLVIDVRSNGGGDRGIFRPLIDALKRNDKINQKGRLFVIIGRGSHSASMMHAVDLRAETNALLVGEPAGSRPNWYSENCSPKIELPNSHLIADCSSRHYKLTKEDTLLLPDIAVGVSSSDFIAGRDPVLARILAYEK